MKTKLLFMLAFLCFFIGNAQWGKQNYCDYGTALSVLNKDTLVYVESFNTQGTTYSTDGGQTWNDFQNPYENSWYHDLHFPTTNIGYACGGSHFGQYKNVIIKTTDAGKTWIPLTANAFAGYEFTNIHFVNANIGFVDSPWVWGKILKTIDGGQNFSDINLPSSEVPTEIYFTPGSTASSSIGFVATRDYLNDQEKYIIMIHRTMDLGNSWTTVFSEIVNDYSAVNTIFFANNNVGYAVGQDGLFLKTTDGGLTWTTQYLAPYTNLTGLHFTSPNIGYINNAGGIYKTTDGGQSWTVQNISPLGVIRKIAFATTSIGFALGDTGVYKTINGGGLNVEEAKQTPLLVYPNPAKEKLHIQVGNGAKIISGVIFNNLGQKVKTFSGTETIAVSGLNTGIYFLGLKTTAGEFYEKIIVN